MVGGPERVFLAGVQGEGGCRVRPVPPTAWGSPVCGRLFPPGRGLASERPGNRGSSRPSAGARQRGREMPASLEGLEFPLPGAEATLAPTFGRRKPWDKQGLAPGAKAMAGAWRTLGMWVFRVVAIRFRLCYTETRT